jgi:hypothetical protein
MKSFFVLLACMVCFLSCDKVLVDIDGYAAKIQGKWQLMEGDTVFYNFQNNLFQYQIYLNKDSILGIYGYYTLYGDTAIDLKLDCKYGRINDVKAYYGSYNVIGWDTISRDEEGYIMLGRSFKISGPSHNKLTLTRGPEQFTFKKF